MIKAGRLALFALFDLRQVHWFPRKFLKFLPPPQPHRQPLARPMHQRSAHHH